MKYTLDLADLRAIENRRSEHVRNICDRLRWAADQLEQAVPPPSLQDGDSAIAATKLDPLGRELLSLAAALLGHASAYRTLSLVDRCSVAASLSPQQRECGSVAAGASGSLLRHLGLEVQCPETRRAHAP